MKVSLLLVPALLFALSAGAVTRKEKGTTTPQPPCCREGLPAGRATEKSLYQLDVAWTADVGREVKLGALGGRPQVFAMFFTSCQHSCPLIVADMKRIEKALPASLRGQVDFLLVSIDPDRDTPEVLREYRARNKLSIERWSLLRGSAESVRKLAALVGFNYYPGSQNQYAHSLFITVLNREGEIIFQRAGLGNEPDEAVAALLRTIKKPARAGR